jgi:uncharacterized protein
VKLHVSAPGPRIAITGYGEGYVLVNSQRHESSLIVMPDQVLPWDVAGFEALSAEHFSSLRNLQPEILLLGTGPKQRFPHPRLTAPLAAAGIGVEVMDLKAACRTYNILVAEERKVAAALLFA